MLGAALVEPNTINVQGHLKGSRQTTHLCDRRPKGLKKISRDRLIGVVLLYFLRFHKMKKIDILIALLDLTNTLAKLLLVALGGN